MCYVWKLIEKIIYHKSHKYSSKMCEVFVFRHEILLNREVHMVINRNRINEWKIAIRTTAE